MARHLTDDAIERKQLNILNAALAVFVRKGYGQSTIPDIAREAGVSVGTIYNYFTGKQQLLGELLRNRFLTDPLVELMDNTGETDEEAFLSALFEDRISFGVENVDTFLFVFSEIQRVPEVRTEYLEHILRPVLNNIQTCVSSGSASGRLKSDSPELVARAIAAVGIGLILLYSIERETSPLIKEDPKKLAATLTNMLLNGLRQNGEDSIEEGSGDE